MAKLESKTVIERNLMPCLSCPNMITALITLKLAVNDLPQETGQVSDPRQKVVDFNLGWTITAVSVQHKCENGQEKPISVPRA